MTTDPSRWTALDPESPPGLSGGTGHVVVVLCVGEPESGAVAVVDLARAWSMAGRRVVLADLGLEMATLHGALDVDNAEGVSDAVSMGASVGRVARRVPDTRMFFISAGTAVADPARLLETPRWSALCHGFLEAGATLVAFAPWELSAREALLEQATDVVLLQVGDQGAVAEAEAAAGDKLRGRIRVEDDSVADEPETITAPDPPADTDAPAHEEHEEVVAFADLAPEPEEDEPEPEAEEPVAFADLAPEPEDDEPVAEEPVAFADLAPEPEDAALEEPRAAAETAAMPHVPLADEILAEAGNAPDEDGGAPPTASPSRAPRDTGGRRTALLVVLLAILAALAAAWWFGYLQLPGLASSVGLDSHEPERVSPLAAAEPVVEVSPLAAWGVALEAHADPAAARNRIARLRAGAPAHLWTRVPVEVDGTVFHRVVLGAAPDRTSAEALARRVATELGTDREGWLVRSTALAFRLREAEDTEEADRWVRAFRADGVPAYVLTVRYSDGSRKHRVYAGGFADAEEARALKAILAGAGVTDVALVDRTGTATE